MNLCPPHPRPVDVAQSLQSGRADFWVEEVVTPQAAAEAMGDKFEVVTAEGVPAARYGVALTKELTSCGSRARKLLKRATDSCETKTIAEKYNLPEEVFLYEATIDKGEG